MMKIREKKGKNTGKWPFRRGKNTRKRTKLWELTLKIRGNWGQKRLKIREHSRKLAFSGEKWVKIRGKNTKNTGRSQK